MNKEHAIVKIRQLLEGRLSDEQWDALIKDLLDNNMQYAEAAKKYGISLNSISTHLKLHKPFAHRQYKSRMARKQRTTKKDNIDD